MKSTRSSRLNHNPGNIIKLVLLVLTCLAVTGIQPASAAPPSIQLYVDRNDDVMVNSGCTTPEDTDTCDLRGAIQLANIGEETDSYTIHLPAGTYTLSRPGDDSNNTNGDLDVFNTTTVIEGAGMNETIITQADISQRIFDLRGDKGLKLMNLTVSGGRLASGFGAGIRSASIGAVLTLENVKVTDNRVTGTAATDIGGGIYLYDTYLNMTGSIISINRAEQGAGIYIINSADGATAKIKKSSIVSNIALSGNGGGIYAGEYSRLELENVTIGENQADGSGMDEGLGGGLYIFNNLAAVLNHVTMARNWASTYGDEISGEVMVYLNATNSIFYNQYTDYICYYPTGTPFIIIYSHLISNQSSDNRCHFGSFFEVDPLLGELGYLGSSTPIYPLLAGSPAMEAAVLTDPVVTTDQRGKPRCDGNHGGLIEPDIGAYEVCDAVYSPIITLP